VFEGGLEQTAGGGRGSDVPGRALISRKEPRLPTDDLREFIYSINPTEDDPFAIPPRWELELKPRPRESRALTIARACLEAMLQMREDIDAEIERHERASSKASTQSAIDDPKDGSVK